MKVVINLTKSKKLIIGGGVIVVLTLIPFITYKYWLPEVAGYLIVQNELIPADVIVVISGRGSRYQHAIRLFKEGYARYILFNYNGQDVFNVVGVKFNPEKMIRDLAISNGIPPERIFTDGRTTSTYEDILYAKENIENNKFGASTKASRVIFVSNNFHMRRVYLTFKKVFKGSDIKPVFAPVPMEMEGINPDGWWTREYDLTFVFNEYVRVLFYYFKYGV